MNSPSKKRILFICTHNSARSQMAEGLLNSLCGDIYEAFSAGTEPSQVNPFAIRVMSEIGINISRYRAKSVQEFIKQKFDYVITVCDSAQESCPFFPGGMKILHKSFKDPAAFKGSDDEKMAVFRQTRDEIRDWLDREFG
ncbi:MAG TPA: arsenate reductase ArsC [Acidobacteriota bacterium]|nr:arsenate reductase ArsC [Acidobacteriota bacterium]